MLTRSILALLLVCSVGLTACENVTIVFRSPGETIDLWSGDLNLPGSQILESINPNAENLQRTDADPQLFSTGSWWIEIKTANNTGWIAKSLYEAYFTGDVSANDFASDTKINLLLTNLSLAVQTNNETLLKSLISPKGLYVHYQGGLSPRTHIAKGQPLITSTNNVTWGQHDGSGEDIKGTFSQRVAKPLATAFSSSYEVHHNILKMGVSLGGTNTIIHYPEDFSKFNYFTVYQKNTNTQYSMDWETWQVVVDYVDGQPTIVGLIRWTWTI